MIAECLGLDPLTSAVAAGYETSIVLALQGLDNNISITKITQQCRVAVSNLGLPPMVACIVADVGARRAAAEHKALRIAEQDENGHKNVSAIVRACKDAAKGSGSPEGVDVCHAVNATLRCLMAGEVARHSTRPDPINATAKAVASMVNVAAKASGLNQNIVDELIEGPICRVFARAVAEWRYNPSDIGRAVRALMNETGRSTAREIKTSAHAAASTLANMKAGEKHSSKLVGRVALEACLGCGMSKAEASRTAAEIAIKSVLAARAQDDDDDDDDV